MTDRARAAIFIEAVKNGDVKAFEIALSEGADPNAADESGMTALMWAARLGENGILARLIDAGAHMDAKDGRGRTAVSHAAAEGNLSGLRVLYRHGADLDKGTKSGEMTPLFAAVSEARDSVIDWLLKKGADPNAMGPEGATAFFIAVRRQDFNLMKKLLDYGADPALAEFSGASPLHAAVLMNKYDLMEAVLKKGADPDFLSVYYNQPPLMLAVSRNDLRAVKILLENKANPNVRNTVLDTSLHAAIRAPDVRIAQALLDAGADCSLKNRRGLSPHDMAMQGRRDYILSLMRQAKVRRAAAGHEENPADFKRVIAPETRRKPRPPSN